MPQADLPLFKELFNPLPCRHQPQVVQQIEPAIKLLRNLDTEHPEVLLKHSIEPQDYHGGLVFRSAVESIRGSYIASSTSDREKVVANVLRAMKQQGTIHDFDQLSNKERWDFEIFPDTSQSYLAVIEVKGGEGNSINISVRSRLVKEFGIWSHLDGSIKNQPSHGAKAIVNRITNELSARGKQVDILFFRDVLCGTRARPCPKYAGQEDTIGMNTCPDIYLFPQRIPTTEEPNPPVHTVDTLRLPKLMLDHFGIPPEAYNQHIWQVNLQLIKRDDKEGRLQRLININHQGQEVWKGRGRLFTRMEQ